MIYPFDPLPAPEEPDTYVAVGYIISGVTAVRLTLKLNGLDLDNLPKGHYHANRLPPPPGTYLMGNEQLIMKSIRKYMIDNGLKSGDAGVDIVTGMIDGDLQTVIVTQSCVIPHGYEGRPEANMGKREECVRQWLECNGVDRESYKWGVYERPCDDW